MDRSSAFALVLAVCSASPALAADTEDPSQRPRGKVRIEMSCGTSTFRISDPLGRQLRRDSFSVAPRVQADYRVLDNVRSRLDIPFAHEAVTKPSESAEDSPDIVVGNVDLGVDGLVQLSDHLQLALGGAIVVPFRGIDDEQTVAHPDRLLMDATAQTHGSWDIWLYRPGIASFVFRAHLDGRIDDFKLELEVDAAVMLPVVDGARAGLFAFPFVERDEGAYPAVQFMAGASWLVEMLEIGVAFHAVNEAVDERDPQRTQLSFQPYVKARFAPILLDVRGVVNITDSGIEQRDFDTGRWWGLQLGVGVELP